VVALALLTGPAVALAACSDYGPQAYDACRGNNVIDPGTGLPYRCNTGQGAQQALDCEACVYTWCVNNTFWCRETCTVDGMFICLAGNGCSLPRSQIWTVTTISTIVY
jgi:hypothetical protein